MTQRSRLEIKKGLLSGNFADRARIRERIIHHSRRARITPEDRMHLAQFVAQNGSQTQATRAVMLLDEREGTRSSGHFNGFRGMLEDPVEPNQ